MPQEAEVPLSILLANGHPASSVEVASEITGQKEQAWTAYVAGCLYMLAAQGHVEAERIGGMNILVSSSVPIGAGVSSSAALEVAAMTAFCGLYGLSLDGLELAALCQRAENQIAGAPCGIMDQVTCALGRAGELLALKCQPHTIQGYVPMPAGWSFVGIDSGVKHSVGGSHYARARVGAFMGLKVLETRGCANLKGYLCNLSPIAWCSWREQVPETLTGREFLQQYGELPDAVTRVDPAETYRVRACAEHPILENDRVRQFIALASLAHPELDPSLLTEAGRLLLDAHASYTRRVDLGAPETDLLVELTMARGPRAGLYGAKITGGGSGGTVAVLRAGPQADSSIRAVCAEYARRTGSAPRVIRGSSAGALFEGPQRLDLRH
jgi:L-arabinokinase